MNRCPSLLFDLLLKEAGRGSRLSVEKQDPVLPANRDAGVRPVWAQAS